MYLFIYLYHIDVGAFVYFYCFINSQFCNVFVDNIMFMSVLLNDGHGTGFHKVIEPGHCRQQIRMDNKKKIISLDYSSLP